MPSLYLSDRKLYPFPRSFLRQILVQNNFDTSGLQTPELAQQLQGLNEVLKYSIIVCIQCASDVSVSVRTEAFCERRYDRLCKGIIDDYSFVSIIKEMFSH